MVCFFNDFLTDEQIEDYESENSYYNNCVENELYQLNSDNIPFYLDI